MATNEKKATVYHPISADWERKCSKPSCFCRARFVVGTPRVKRKEPIDDRGSAAYTVRYLCDICFKAAQVNGAFEFKANF